MIIIHKNIKRNSNDSCTPSSPVPLPRLPRIPPPPPPPPPPTVNQSFSPLLIVMFGGLTVTFCFICYLICVTRYLRRRPNRVNADLEAHNNFVNEDLGPVTHHPIWLIQTIGLDQSQIESIQVFKYKQDEKLIEHTDCSVCLSEFEDDESLRLLPKCSHAFHVPCIDTWLRSHKNCPLCRAPIVNNTNDQPNVIASSTHEETETETETEIEAIPVNDSETIDNHVVEVDNNGEMVKTSSIEDEPSSSGVQGKELVPIRRSFSNGQLVVSKKPSIMPKSEHKRKGSSSSIRVSGKVTKSSSFARSLRKASSFTSKGRPYNQSY